MMKTKQAQLSARSTMVTWSTKFGIPQKFATVPMFRFMRPNMSLEAGKNPFPETETEIVAKRVN